MLKRFRGDLHIHTCLSPCADLTMSPKRVVEKAVKENLDMIAICDHNSAENVGAAMAAAANKKITVLPGMEVTTVEEVHIIALFDELHQVLDLQRIVYEHLPPEENREDIFGEQIVANEFDDVEGYNNRLLMAATQLTLEKWVDEIHTLGGLVIAAHIDREAYNSIIGQLGFIPPDLELDALEISSHTSPSHALERYPGIEEFPLISSSDAHYLQDIGKATSSFLLDAPGVDEIRKAFKKQDGRNLLIEQPIMEA
ncbi:MAG: PHP domain-containing protein [Candidatus Aminicenantes bacterium]|nr:PHP domain-containing protein [Candidatus Aminicenantes bacterium]NIM82492.1 PHP domain-containing protein [Candidatus Aminicenantes bacterium]NIN19044.1 PHP domain-containing protein [Candidatus Aminicenantes bacterium]NIN42946.1 PHP domain-containing protein [Candidatus Aminicenantes bacterium]NIN85683.1 PHP domain-containing protein [Candidatus Aminicenantes bacterium]